MIIDDLYIIYASCVDEVLVNSSVDDANVYISKRVAHAEGSQWDAAKVYFPYT